MNTPALPAVRLVDVRAERLSVDEVVAAVSDPAAGGLCLFLGIVRDNADGREVDGLDYTAHPSAVDRLREVAESIARTDDVVAVAAVHRVGDLAVGDVAVVCAVAAGHRPAAFEAGRRFIDELKAHVPIWKNESFVDGQAVWVGLD